MVATLGGVEAAAVCDFVQAAAGNFAAQGVSAADRFTKIPLVAGGEAVDAVAFERICCR